MKNIFIYGSCVSRDAFKLLPENYNLITYIARQSLISAYSDPVKASVAVKLDSAFQKRMVSGDLKSNLPDTLSRFSKNTDLLLIDLTDERLGIDLLTSTMRVTHSVELVDSGWLKTLKTRPQLVEIGTERHWTLWTSAARKFFTQLNSQGLVDRTLVIYTPWATSSADGEEVPLFRRHTSAQMSLHLAKCAAFLEGLGLEVSYMPANLAVTTNEHTWGIAPYHYVDGAYQWIAEKIVRKIEKNSGDVK